MLALAGVDATCRRTGVLVIDRTFAFVFTEAECNAISMGLCMLAYQIDRGDDWAHEAKCMGFSVDDLKVLNNRFMAAVSE